MVLHPEFLIKNGKKEFVVITYEEYCKIEEIIEDYEDLKTLREIKSTEQNSPTISHKELIEKLALNKE